MKNDDLQHRVTLFLDKELNQEEEQSFLNEVDQDKQFKAMLDQEQHFKTYIKSHVARPNVSPSLIRSIKEKISISPS
jgi:predicted lactoylglutathione lyase